jgi:hypothetical protein
MQADVVPIRAFLMAAESFQNRSFEARIICLVSASDILASCGVEAQPTSVVQSTTIPRFFILRFFPCLTGLLQPSCESKAIRDLWLFRQLANADAYAHPLAVAMDRAHRFAGAKVSFLSVLRSYFLAVRDAASSA